MKDLLIFLSNLFIPMLFFIIIGYALLQKRAVYTVFISGAKKGIGTIVQIVPTLLGLFIGIRSLRACGFLDFLSSLTLQLLPETLHLPPEFLSMTIVRMFSSSAATGLLLDIYQTYGTDSFAGLLASICMSSTETIFYTMSVYFMAAKVTKTRWTLPGALAASLAGIIASFLLANLCA